MRLPASLALAAALACAHGPSAKDREMSEIHYNLGVEALRGGRPQEAVREFDASLALDPRFADAHLGRGLVLEYGFDRKDEAEKAYRRAIELRPAFSEAHNNLGQLLAQGDRLAEALREFDLALENMLYREPFIARCNKGQVLWRMGRRDDGLAEIRACLSLSPRYCQGHRALGRLYLEDGRTREALAAFERYAESCDGSADAWYQMGLAHLKAGARVKAREAFERCESLGGDGALGSECRRSRLGLQ